MRSMVRVAVARRVGVSCSDRVMVRAVRAAARAAGVRGDDDIEISVALVGRKRIHELNRTYHHEDRVTDVLAFGLHATPGQNRAGELVVCPAYIRAYAKRAHESLRRSLARVLVHGTLHLLGHDHARPKDAERMFALQERIMRAVGE